MRKSLFHLSMIVFLVLFLSFSAYGQSTPKTVAELEQEVEMLKKRISELEEQQKPKTPRKPVWPSPFLEEDPFGEMQRVQDEMSRLLHDSFSRGSSLSQGLFSSNMNFQNKINMVEQEDGYEIVVEMDNVDEKNLSIDIQADAITLKGQNIEEKKTAAPDNETALRSYSSFMQRIALPEDADFASVKTEKKGNALVIFVPKKK